MCSRWTPLDAVVIFQSDLPLCVCVSVSGCVRSAATSQLWFQLLKQLATSLHAPNDWRNAEVWCCLGSKSEWGGAACLSEGHWVHYDGFVDNLQSIDSVKFSLVDVWVYFWAYLLMLYAQPCLTREVFPVCSIIGGSSCTVPWRDHAHLKILTFATCVVTLSTPLSHVFYSFQLHFITFYAILCS